MTIPPTPAHAGLEDVVIGNSSICFIDGREGRLLYRGYDINELVEHSRFEEVVFLLWHGRLPNKKELPEHEKALAASRKLPGKVLALLKGFPRKATPTEVLRTTVSALSLYDSDAENNSMEASFRKAMRVTGQIATIVASWARIRAGKKPVPPNSRLSAAANFLYMVHGKKPHPLWAKTFDMALILHADHELNASTFSGRVTASTLSDMHSAITSAIGTLKGPLHGGANEAVVRMLQEIGEPERAEVWIKNALAQKRRIMGFGHRVYKTEDPRAAHLRRMAEALGRQSGNLKWYEILRTVERLVGEEKGLYPNVDLYSGACYYAMGIPVDLCVPIFAVSRVSGWTAHVLEQYADNRLIRPRAEYVGPTRLSYSPLAQRK